MDERDVRVPPSIGFATACNSVITETYWEFSARVGRASLAGCVGWKKARP